MQRHNCHVSLLQRHYCHVIDRVLDPHILIQTASHDVAMAGITLARPYLDYPDLHPILSQNPTILSHIVELKSGGWGTSVRVSLRP